MPGFSSKVRKFIKDTWHDLWCCYAGFPEPDDKSFDQLDPRNNPVHYRWSMSTIGQDGHTGPSIPMDLPKPDLFSAEWHSNWEVTRPFRQIVISKPEFAGGMGRVCLPEQTLAAGEDEAQASPDRGSSKVEQRPQDSVTDVSLGEAPVAGSSPAPDQPIRYRPGRPFSGGFRAGRIMVRIPIAELLDVKASWMVPGVIADKLIDAGVPVEHTLLTGRLLYGTLIEKILPEEMVYVWVDDNDPM